MDSEEKGGQGFSQSAESYIEKGKKCIELSFWESGVDNFSIAIKIDPSNAQAYVYRARCNAMFDRWKEVVKDSRTTLELDASSAESMYLLGAGLLRLEDSGEAETSKEGLEMLGKAKSLLKPGDTVLAGAIRKGILFYKKKFWLQNAEKQKNERESLQTFLVEKLKILENMNVITTIEYSTYTKLLSKFFDQVEEERKPFNVPDFLCCKISMDLLDEPVCTPDGITYEKSLILRHLAENGAVEPLTSRPCPASSLVPNYAIKQAVQYFLDRYPWLYDYDMG